MINHRPRTPDLNFVSLPPVGLTIEVRGVEYQLIEHARHIRSDGDLVTIGRWKGRCLCGEPFEFLAAGKTDYVRRNCDRHKGLKAPDFEMASESVAGGRLGVSRHG
jgi:hypothetical protein